jgi:hypothetical protein
LLLRRSTDHNPRSLRCIRILIAIRLRNGDWGGEYCKLAVLAGAVPLPGKLDGDRGPRLPAGGVEAHRALQLLVGELVAEVLRDVLEVLGVQGERLRDSARGQRGGGQREVVAEGLAEAPGYELLAAEVARPQQALAGAVVVHQAVRAFHGASHYEQHLPHGLALVQNLQSLSIQTLMISKPVEGQISKHGFEASICWSWPFKDELGFFESLVFAVKPGPILFELKQLMAYRLVFDEEFGLESFTYVVEDLVVHLFE